MIEIPKKGPSPEKEAKTTSFEVIESATPAVIPPIIPLPTVALSPLIQISELRNRIQEEEKLPEIQVPVKKYYGRKRDDQSSSEEDLNLEDSVEKNDKTKYEFDFR